MKRDILKEIKEMMKESHRNAALLAREAKNIEKEYKVKMKEEEKECDCFYWTYRKQQIETEMLNKINNLYKSYDGETMYYIIYKDGSCIAISDEDLINNEKMPKLTDIVFASYNGPNDSWDTEIGELHWYEDVDDYEAEDERKAEYENAIEIKYNTKYGKHLKTKMM